MNTTIWTIFGVDEDGDETFACAQTEDGRLSPMITNTERGRDRMLAAARKLASTQDSTLRLVRFDSATLELEIPGKPGGN